MGPEMNTRKILRGALLGAGAYVSSLLILLLLGVTLGLNEYLVVAATVIVFLPIVTGLMRRLRKWQASHRVAADPASLN